MRKGRIEIHRASERNGESDDDAPCKLITSPRGYTCPARRRHYMGVITRFTYPSNGRWTPTNRRSRKKKTFTDENTVRCANCSVTDPLVNHARVSHVSHVSIHAVYRTLCRYRGSSATTRCEKASTHKSPILPPCNRSCILSWLLP